MPAQAVLFDLDGTLLNTLADIALATNAALALESLPPHPEAAYRRFIGDGVFTLVRRALPPGLDADDELVARCAARFHETYARYWNVATRPYSGVPELLDALLARGLPLAILSNKPDEFTHHCVGAYLGRWTWGAVVGQIEGVPRKPDPTSALGVAARMEIAPADFVYVGDTGVDMKTARGAGMKAVGVSWGFRPVEELRAAGAEAIIDHPLDLLPLL